MVGTIDHLRSNLDDNTELYEMSKADEAFDDLAAIEADAAELRKIVEQLEFRRMFSNPADPLNCFVDIQAGAGGTEACDWAGMLLRQYLKYCERKGFKATMEDETPGEIAGIKSATIKVEGDYAFGHLRTETGVHRLVRKSPFDSAGGRHTSFASIFVYPEVDDSIEIEINPSDVRTDTFRASGAGGQHINKTDSAVRLTHIPTGIVVQCQNDRSQHRNRDEAWQMLRSRLYEHEMRKQREQVQQYVTLLEKQLPSKAEMDALLSDINQAGIGRSLQFDLFRPGQVSVKEYYAELPIAVRVTGRYNDIGLFTSDIAHLSRIVTLNNLTLLPARDGSLSLDATAKTFRYLDPEEVAAQRQAAAPKGSKK